MWEEKMQEVRATVWAPPTNCFLIACFLQSVWVYTVILSRLLIKISQREMALRVHISTRSWKKYLRGEEIPTSMVWRLWKRWNGHNGHTRGEVSPSLGWESEVRMIAELLFGTMQECRVLMTNRHPAKLWPAGPQGMPDSDSWIPVHCLPASKKQLPMQNSLQQAPECEQRSSGLRWCIWFNIKWEKIGDKRNTIAIMFDIFCVCSELITGRKWT